MKIRLYTTEKIDIGSTINLNEKQCNYLVNVLRLKDDDDFYVFDGINGEFLARLESVSRKKFIGRVVKQTSDFYSTPDIWLIFAPLKKDCVDMIIQKATELGVRKIVPVLTDFTNSDKVRKDKIEKQCIEAAEQCRRMDIPEVCDLIKLNELIEKWEEDRKLFFLNEKGNGNNIFDVMKNNKGKAAILIGPEGGFSNAECEKILALKAVCPIYLGKRILRAETAGIASLACWQAINGDW